MIRVPKRFKIGLKIVAGSVGVMATLLLLLDHQLYRFKTKLELPKNWSDTLEAIAFDASKGDLPVSAILVFKDSIIGYGHNTIKADRNLAGHADINAMNMAYASYGEEFFELDREELFLFTTNEPCYMCKGISINLNIKNVIFGREKELPFQVKKRFQSIQFEFYHRQMEMGGLQ